MTNGIGTKHFGKANHVEDKDNEAEEFDTTLWVSILWIPIIPLRSYRIRQKIWYVRKVTNIWPEFEGGVISWKEDFHVVRYHPLNWKQICRTYLLTYGLLAGLVTIRIVIELLFGEQRGGLRFR